MWHGTAPAVMIAEPQRSAGAAGAGEFLAQEGGVCWLQPIALRSLSGMCPDLWGSTVPSAAKPPSFVPSEVQGWPPTDSARQGKKKKMEIMRFFFQASLYKNKGVYKCLCFPANIYTN